MWLFPKWWICCFCFTHVVHHVIREIICRCSRIILALSSHVRCSLLVYISSPLRACLTISYHTATAAPTRLLHLNIILFSYRKSSIFAIITALQTVSLFFFIVLYGNQLVHPTLKTVRLPALIRKLVARTPQ